MNAHAVTLERFTKSRMMGFLHANFSIGTFSGALIGGLFSQYEVTVAGQETLFAMLILFLILILWKKYLPALADIHVNQHTKSNHERSPFIFWILGFFGLCAAMSEGAAGDWGGVLSRDTFGASPFLSTIPYIAYCTTMVLGRLSCDRLADKYGSENVIKQAV
jgi:hypothetical protein